MILMGFAKHRILFYYKVTIIIIFYFILFYLVFPVDFHFHCPPYNYYPPIHYKVSLIRSSLKPNRYPF